MLNACCYTIQYLEPDLNSFMMASLSFCGMSPCMEDTVKLASLIFSVNQSTCTMDINVNSPENHWHSVTTWHSKKAGDSGLARYVSIIVLRATLNVIIVTMKISDSHIHIGAERKQWYQGEDSPFSWCCRRWQPVWLSVCHRGHRVCQTSILPSPLPQRTAWCLPVSTHHC